MLHWYINSLQMIQERWKHMGVLMDCMWNCIYSVSHSLPNPAFMFGRPPVRSSNKVPLVSSFFDKTQLLDLLGGCRPPDFSGNCCWHDIKEMPGSVASGTQCIILTYSAFVVITSWIVYKCTEVNSFKLRKCWCSNELNVLVLWKGGCSVVLIHLSVKVLNIIVVIRYGLCLTYGWYCFVYFVNIVSCIALHLSPC
jgi:hypothetical protein